MKDLFAPFFIFVLLIFFQAKVEKKEIVFPPPMGMEYYNFGFQDLAADSMWLNFIQNSQDCFSEKKKCFPRWGYLVLNEATKLSPQYKVLYTYGAVLLGVLLGEPRGAVEILEKGFKNFPKDWIIPYRAAYLYMDELDQKVRAAELLDQAASLGAPFWARDLASKLYNKTGHLDVSYRILLEMYQGAPEGEWKEGLKKRIEDLRKKLKIGA